MRPGSSPSARGGRAGQGRVQVGGLPSVRHGHSERLAELLARPLDDRRRVIVFIDGFGMGEHTMAGRARSGRPTGTRSRWGVVEGSTENAAVCTRLAADLAERGLDASAGVLFVVDGGKANGLCHPHVYGRKAVIQRCRRHKERNILDHLPRDRTPTGVTQAARRLGQPRSVQAKPTWKPGPQPGDKASRRCRQLA